MYYEVAAWDLSLGTTFNPVWLTGIPFGLFSISAVGSGVAGGGPQNLPTLQLFGGTGITQGFTLTGPVFIPEPSSMALFCLGAAALVIFRRMFRARMSH
jgi:PEP-CTERM motif